MNSARGIILECTTNLSLPDQSGMSDEDLALVLLTYQGVIEPNFVPWMAKVWTQCVSTVAAQACYDNLLCEIQENHPLMLRLFVEPARAFVSRGAIRAALRFIMIDHKHYGETLIQILDRYCSARMFSGADSGSGLAVMATLEGTSIAFIPWLEAAAKRLGVTDCTYTEKHGIADLAHAEQFAKAMEEEASVMKTSLNRAACDDAATLIRTIFNVHLHVPSGMRFVLE